MSGKLIHNLKRKRAQLAELSSDTNDSVTSGGADKSPVRQDAPSAARKKVKLQPQPQVDKELPKHDILKEALLKVQALQAELAALDDGDLDELDYDSGNEEDENDLIAFEAEALGFAVCARETMRFLAAQGLSPDHPVVLNLRSRLVGKCSGLPI